MPAWSPLPRRIAGRAEHAAIVLVALTGLIGVAVSPVPEYSFFRLGLFFLGIATWIVVVAWVVTPGRAGLAVAGLAVAAGIVTAGGLTASYWMIHKFPPMTAVLVHLPRVPDAVLGSLGAPARVSPNQLAGLLALIVPPLAGIVVFSIRARSGGRTLPRPIIALAAVALVPAFAYLGLSFARGAILTLSIALLVLLYARSARLGLLATAAGIVVVVSAFRFLPPQFVASLLFTELLAPQWFAGLNRYEYWQAGVDFLRGSPWTGIGLGAFPAIYLDRVQALPFYACIVVPHVHNLYLQAALDLGIPGALAYLGLIGAGAAGAVRFARRIGWGAAAGLGYGLAAGLLAFALFGLFDTITVTSRATPVIWLIAGLGTALGRLPAGVPADRPPGRSEDQGEAVSL